MSVQASRLADVRATPGQPRRCRLCRPACPRSRPTSTMNCSWHTTAAHCPATCRVIRNRRRSCSTARCSPRCERSMPAGPVGRGREQEAPPSGSARNSKAAPVNNVLGTASAAVPRRAPRPSMINRRQDNAGDAPVVHQLAQQEQCCGVVSVRDRADMTQRMAQGHRCHALERLLDLLGRRHRLR